MTTLSIELLAGIAHELRTPLGAIGGFAELMALGVHGPVTPKQTEGLERIRVNQRLMVSLISSFMAYAEAVTSTEPLALGPVAVEDVVARVLDELAPRMRERGIQIDVTGIQGAVVVANGGGLQSLLRELVVDAIESAPTPGEVRLSAAGAPQLVLEVRSPGEAFPPDVVHAVFQPFAREAKSGRSSASRHALSLPHAFVVGRSMGGQVEAVADPTARVVTVRLPRA